MCTDNSSSVLFAPHLSFSVIEEAIQYNTDICFYRLSILVILQSCGVFSFCFFVRSGEYSGSQLSSPSVCGCGEMMDLRSAAFRKSGGWDAGIGWALPGPGCVIRVIFVTGWNRYVTIEDLAFLRFCSAFVQSLLLGYLLPLFLFRGLEVLSLGVFVAYTRGIW